VGVTTYGKGTVQNYFSLSDGGLARITIARWLTPNGNTIDKKGLTPDQVVEMTAADYTAGKDPQLDAAVQLLLKK
jgi:carboxyl-terminal processing protease